ncbi:MAG: tRNA (adenosine(37)-N6)-dimethylallyltransferase MiaA [Microthrixaceae bacterium]
MSNPDRDTATAPGAPAPRAGRHLVLVGCTASGKSAVALELARRRTAAGRPTEIISCDSMAVYRGMDVGTATPTEAERAVVPHHLIDVADPSEEYSVVRFRDDVAAALAGVEGRGADAVLVGGTGLYVRAVTDGLQVPGRYPEVLEALEELPIEELRARLEELDPLGARRIEPNNRRRLLRALEVTLGSGRPFSAGGPGLGVYEATPFVLTGIRLPRDVVGERVAARWDAQMAAGLLDEVRALAARPDGLSRTAAEALGYRELLTHLRGECSLEEAAELAVRRTRQFAVRQERWFRRDPRITWFDPPDPRVPDRAALAERIDAHWSECARERRGSAATVGGPAPTLPTH